MATFTPTSQDVARSTLSVLAVLGLLVASAFVLKPFFPGLVWGTTIVVATWPVLLRVRRWVGGRRGLAVAVMTALLTAVVLIPLYLALSSLLARTEGLADLIRSLANSQLPPPPDWLASLPLFGPRLAAAWQRLSETGLAGQGVDLAPWVARFVRFLTTQARGLASTLVHLLVTLVVCASLYATGERSAVSVQRFFRRLAGRRGDEAVLLAAKAIRAVALGVGLTALVQTVLAGAGLLLAGVPHSGLLIAVILLLCIAQLGPALVLIPSAIWLFTSGRPVAGTLFLVWAVVPMTMDNFLRPYLIKRSADLPFWLILMGVVGGLLAFGVIGLFIGPVILAVGYTLVQDWVADLGPEPTVPVAPPEPAPATTVGTAP